MRTKLQAMYTVELEEKNIEQVFLPSEHQQSPDGYVYGWVGARQNELTTPEMTWNVSMGRKTPTQQQQSSSNGTFSFYWKAIPKDLQCSNLRGSLQFLQVNLQSQT